jgi:hypothetical protein
MIAYFAISRSIFAAIVAGEAAIIAAGYWAG